GQLARIASNGGTRSVHDDARVVTRKRREAPKVGLDQVRPAVRAEADVATEARDLAQGTGRGAILRARHRHQRLEEPPLVALGRREVDGETSVRALETSVHEAMADGVVAPLVDVDERLV